MKALVLLCLVLFAAQAKAVSVDRIFYIPDAFGAGDHWYTRYQYNSGNNSAQPSFSATTMDLSGQDGCYDYKETIRFYPKSEGSATPSDFARQYDGHALAKGESIKLARLSKGTTEDVVQIFQLSQSDWVKICQEGDSSDPGTDVSILEFTVAHDGSSVHERGKSVHFPLALGSVCGDNSQDLKTLANIKANPEQALQLLAAQLPPFNSTPDQFRKPAPPACIGK
jgi:hypothetical protein